MTDQNKPNRPVKVYVIDKSLKLRAKQAAFVYEYLIDYNATQAAIRAGYSKNSADVIAAQNLGKLRIAQAIDDGKWFYQYQNGIDADWVRKELIRLYHRCMDKVPEIKWNQETRDFEKTGAFTFEPSTAKASLELMGKDVGIFQTNVNVHQSGDVNHHHEHTVKEQMNFDAIRSKVDKHKDNALH